MSAIAKILNSYREETVQNISKEEAFNYNGGLLHTPRLFIQYQH